MIASERAVVNRVELDGGSASDLALILLLGNALVGSWFSYGESMGIMAKAIAMHSIIVASPSLIACSHMGL